MARRNPLAALPAGALALLAVSKNTITLAETRKGAAYCRFKGQPPAARGHRVRVRHPNGLELTVTGDFPVKYFALYADARAVSPEPFIAIDLGPGKTARWTRAYRFASRPRPAE